MTVTDKHIDINDILFNNGNTGRPIAYIANIAKKGHDYAADFGDHLRHS